jgi:hypothetical protein
VTGTHLRGFARGCAAGLDRFDTVDLLGRPLLSSVAHRLSLGELVRDYLALERVFGGGPARG